MWYKAFLVRLSATRLEYLKSLNPSDVIYNFISSKPDNEQQFYINELRKNPNISLSQLQLLSPKEKKQVPFNSNELACINKFSESPVYKKWVEVQLRIMREKHREPNAFNILSHKLDLIYDWWRFTTPAPQISSYSFEQADNAQVIWHETMAGKGEGKIYEKTNPANIVYAPKDWHGWSIQEVTSENDLECEGGKMNHCVGGYYEYVKNGEIKIYSLRDNHNNPKVTIEIDANNKIEQAMANSNQEPSPELAKMVGEWLRSTGINYDISNISNRYDIPYDEYNKLLDKNTSEKEFSHYIKGVYNSSNTDNYGFPYKINNSLAKYIIVVIVEKLLKLKRKSQEYKHLYDDMLDYIPKTVIKIDLDDMSNQRDFHGLAQILYDDTETISKWCYNKYLNDDLRDYVNIYYSQDLDEKGIKLDNYINEHPIFSFIHKLHENIGKLFKETNYYHKVEEYYRKLGES